jgi:hypothetical protein
MKGLVNTAAIAAMALVVSAAAPAAAHHSAAMFDATKIVVVDATVKEVRWTNPHVNLLVFGKVKEGEEPGDWLLETTSPGRLIRRGWMRTSFNPGDRIRVEIHPLSGGDQHGGSIQKITSVETGKSFATELKTEDAPDAE